MEEVRKKIEEAYARGIIDSSEREKLLKILEVLGPRVAEKLLEAFKNLAW